MLKLFIVKSILTSDSSFVLISERTKIGCPTCSALNFMTLPNQVTYKDPKGNTFEVIAVEKEK